MTPDWALALIYWVHMSATVVWIGGLAAISLLLVPISRASLSAQDQAILLEKVLRRFDPLSWLSLLALVATGLFQMSANPNYSGFLALTNRWAVAILLKHLVFGGMIGVSASLSWGVLPALKRAALLRKKGLTAPDEERLQQRERLLLRLNLGLGVLVLVLTALARVSQG